MFLQNMLAIIKDSDESVKLVSLCEQRLFQAGHFKCHFAGGQIVARHRVLARSRGASDYAGVQSDPHLCGVCDVFHVFIHCY